MSIEDLGYISEMRQRLGCKENETTDDDRILEMSPWNRVKLIVGWYLGDPGWADSFKGYCESQGVFLTTNASDTDIII